MYLSLCCFVSSLSQLAVLDIATKKSIGKHFLFVCILNRENTIKHHEKFSGLFESVFKILSEKN